MKYKDFIEGVKEGELRTVSRRMDTCELQVVVGPPGVDITFSLVSAEIANHDDLFKLHAELGELLDWLEGVNE